MLVFIYYYSHFFFLCFLSVSISVCLTHNDILFPWCNLEVITKRILVEILSKYFLFKYHVQWTLHEMVYVNKTDCENVAKQHYISYRVYLKLLPFTSFSLQISTKPMDDFRILTHLFVLYPLSAPALAQIIKKPPVLQNSKLHV